MTSSPTASLESDGSSGPSYHCDKMAAGVEGLSREPIVADRDADTVGGGGAGKTDERCNVAGDRSLDSSLDSAPTLQIHTPMDNISLTSSDSPVSNRKFSLDNGTTSKCCALEDTGGSYAGVGGGVLGEESLYSPSRVGFELLKKLESANRFI